MTACVTDFILMVRNVSAVGRIFVGYASEHMHAARIWVFIVSVFLSGVVTILIFACNTLLHLLIVMGAFGLLVGFANSIPV